MQWHEKKQKKTPKHKNMESDLDFESKIWTLNCPIGFNWWNETTAVSEWIFLYSVMQLSWTWLPLDACEMFHGMHL